MSKPRTILLALVVMLAGSLVCADSAASLEATPNDQLYSSQYALKLMGFPAAWTSSAGYGSSSIKVAVIDSGLRRTHEDFVGGRILQGYDYYSHDAYTNDGCGHGTATTGVLAATTNNGKGIAGATQATILPLKVLGPPANGFCDGRLPDLAQAIRDAADQGARVISMSLGRDPDQGVEDAINYAFGRGAVLVAAGGNDGRENDVNYPGAYSNVVGVGAIDRNKVRAGFSDGGPELDVVAPGVDIIKPSKASNTSYKTGSGTSLATAYVSGVIAYALSCASTLTNVQIIQALYDTVEDLGPVGRDDGYGRGLVRVDRLVQKVC